jgi:hypothetical protein
MDQIVVSAELRVDCATLLLSNRAQTWWDIVKERRDAKTLRWRDFMTKFENQCETLEIYNLNMQIRKPSCKRKTESDNISMSDGN